MAKQIRLTEYMGPSQVYDLDEFIKAQITDAEGNAIMPEDGGMESETVDQLRSLEVGESMPLGEPEAGLTVERLPDNRG